MLHPTGIVTSRLSRHEFRFALGKLRPHFACEVKCKTHRPCATDISSPITSEEGTRDSGRIVDKPEAIARSRPVE
jgi:hypothetical protein